MLKRRTFLQSGLLTFYVPSGNWLSAAISDPLMISTRIITATGCTDTRVFTSALPILSDTVDLYRGENLYELAATLEHNQCATLAGLTRHSEFILISQIATESGYTLIYTGTHHYRVSTLDHHLEGNVKLVNKFADSIASGEVSWPREFACYIPEIILSGGSVIHKDVQQPIARPPDSPGYLVSWAFRRD